MSALGKVAGLAMKIRAHKAVESLEVYPGEIFVALKPGYHWSQQRSFGTETLGKAWKLLKEVEVGDVE